jgi:hypothetical protein
MISPPRGNDNEPAGGGVVTIYMIMGNDFYLDISGGGE